MRQPAPIVKSATTTITFKIFLIFFNEINAPFEYILKKRIITTRSRRSVNISNLAVAKHVKTLDTTILHL
jgi:hypothetical protein